MNGGSSVLASARSALFLLILVALGAPGTTFAALATGAGTPVASPGSASIARDSGVHFEPNLGQAPNDIRYVGRGGHVKISLLDRGAIVQSTTPGALARVQLTFPGATGPSRGRGEARADARVNYFVGRDSSRWLRNVPTYGQVRYENLYPGVDLVYYGNRGGFEYDLVVMPGADPNAIRMRFDGSHRPILARSGDLLLDGPKGRMRLDRPLVYQNSTHGRRLLDGRFVLEGEREVRFEVPDYDRTRPLIIDPTFKLLYSTYLGGVHDDQSQAAAVDAQNNVYVVGYSGSEDFPVSASAYQPARKQIGSYVRNVVVAKFDASGTLLYSTFLGGTTNDYGKNIAVDASGNAYITGATYSADFPTTSNAFQSAFRGGKSAYLAVLGPDGAALKLSTLYGGTGGAEANGVRLRDGKVYLGGFAGSGLPTTAGVYKTALTTGDGGFVAIFDPTQSGTAQLLAATYYGTDTPATNSVATGLNVIDLALDPQGGAWIGGQAFTNNLPTTPDALQPTIQPLNPSCQAGNVSLNGAAYVAHLSADLKQLIYATYLSGQQEQAANAACAEYVYALQTDSSGALYIHGSTASGNFPVTTGAVQPTFPGNGGFAGYVGFASKLSADGRTLVWSTYLGGSNSGATYANRTALDANGALWLTGATHGGSNFPITSDAYQATLGGGYDAYVVALDGSTGALRYGSYFGGSSDEVGTAVIADAGGTVYLAGVTSSTNLPVTSTAFQPTLTPHAFDGSDWFFSIFGSGAIARVLPASAGNAGDVTLTLTGAGFQDGATCTLSNTDRSLDAKLAVLADDARTLSCNFALANVPAAAYDVIVTNPDGTTFRRKSGFTLKSGTGSDVEVEVLGRSTIRTGVPASYSVVVTNNGDADAVGVMLIVRYSAGLKPVDPSQPDPFGLGLIPVPHLSATDTEDYSQNSIVTSSALEQGASVVPLLLPVIPPGTSTTFSLPLVSSTDSDNEYVEAIAYDAIADSQDGVAIAQASPARTSALGLMMQAFATTVTGETAAARVQPQALSSDCLKALWDYAWDKASGKIPGVDCFRDFQRSIFELKRYEYTHPANRGAFLGDVSKSLFKNATDCAELAGIELAAIAEATKTFLDLLEDLDKLGQISDKCKDKDKDKGKGKKKKKPTKSKQSTDPNDKSGPLGDGSSEHFIQGDQPFSYSIAFENLPAASLPAAEVVIADQLDPGKLDLTSFALGSISFGTHRIEVPPGLKNFNTIYPIDATMSVRLQGSLDVQTGLLKYTFTTLDPATHLPPSDPTLGFLPPDHDGAGQGYVVFTVNPVAGLADGTAITNQASVVFDANTAIQTPVWTNTIDHTAPTSRVTALAARTDPGNFTVSWSGNDAGSAAKTYSIYVSDNGAAFNSWQSNVTATSATYGGQDGHTYAFYSVATDGAGNTEGLKTVADTSTQVAAAATGGGGNNSGSGSTSSGGGGAMDWLTLSLGAALLAFGRRRLARVGQ